MQIADSDESEIDFARVTEGLCGRWMPRKKATCARRPGHAPPCMTTENMASRRVYRRNHPHLESPESKKKSNRKYRISSAKVLAARLYGVGPVTALALTCWLGGAGRFSSSRKAVRFAGLDVTVHSSDRKGPPGRLSRQGPPVLRWAVYEAGKTHARASAPDHRYYAQVKDRCNGKRAALSEARKILRQACHVLAELGDDALAPAA